MSKKLVVAGLIGIPALLAFIQYAGSNGALIERFPQYDRKIVTRAHRIILRNTLLGKYPNAETDEDYDAIFYEVVATLS